MRDDNDEPVTVPVPNIRIEHLVDLKTHGCYIGECAAWSCAAHAVALLRSEIEDARLRERLEALEKCFASNAETAAVIANRFR